MMTLIPGFFKLPGFCIKFGFSFNHAGLCSSLLFLPCFKQGLLFRNTLLLLINK
jgi:hypothetical protein